MHVLVSGDRGERTRYDVGVEGVEGGQHAGELVVGQQAGAVQHPRVGPRTGDIEAGQSPVEVRRQRQRGQRVGRAAGEATAPELQRRRRGR